MSPMGMRLPCAEMGLCPEGKPKTLFPKRATGADISVHHRQRRALHLESASASHHGAAASLLDQSEVPHLESAFASHRGAAASLLDQSEVHGGSVAKGKPPARLSAWCSRQALRLLATDTSTHLESASTLHRGAAAGLLDQSEVHGGSVAQCHANQLLGPRDKHSPIGVPAKQYKHAP